MTADTVMASLRLHPDILIGAIIILAVVAIVLLAIAIRVVPPWVHGVRYSRAPGGHRRDVSVDPVWGETTAHDMAWDDGLRDELGDEWAPQHAACSDPDCSTMTHTGQLPAFAPKHALMPLPDWHTQDPRPVETVGLPPWEDDGLDHSLDPMYQRVLEIERELTDLPDPVAIAPQGDRAGELHPRRKRSHRPWYGDFGPPDPQPLLAPAPNAVPAAAPPTPGLPDRGKEAVLEGVIVDGPLTAPADTWLEEQLADLRDWAAVETKILTEWSQQYALERAS